MKKIPKGYEQCGWQGYGQGAAYEDAGCADGVIVDLDGCDYPGGPCIVVGDQCPNCGGKGIVPKGQPMRGPMALIRQRHCQEICSDIMDIAETDDQREAASACCASIEQVYELVRKLGGDDK